MHQPGGYRAIVNELPDQGNRSLAYWLLSPSGHRLRRLQRLSRATDDKGRILVDGLNRFDHVFTGA